MEELRQKKQLIDDRIADLQQSVRFCTNEYKYHHNNEMQILSEQMTMIEEAEQCLREMVEQIHKLDGTLGQALTKCNQADAQMAQIKQKEKNTASDEEQFLNGYDSNKEN